MTSQTIICTLKDTGQAQNCSLPALKGDLNIVDGYWVDQNDIKTTLWEYNQEARFLLVTKNSIGNKVRILLIQKDEAIPLNGLEGKVFDITADEMIVEFEITRQMFTSGGQTEDASLAKTFLMFYEESEDYEEGKTKGKFPTEKLKELPVNEEDFLRIHLVRFIPEVMEQKGWVKGKEVQDIWFSSDANSNPESATPQVNFLSEEWMEDFSRLQEQIEKAKNSWKTPKGKNYLRKQIQKMKAQGFLEFPSEKHPVMTFGFFGMSLITNEEGSLIPEIEKFYHQNEAYDTKGWYGALEELSDHFATLANHNIRIAAKGLLFYIRGKIIVKVIEIGVYLQDSFNFNDSRFLPSQPLGYFNFVTGEVSKSPGSGFYYFDNDSYKRYRKDHEKGGDFELYSEVIEIPVANLRANISLKEKDAIRNEFNKKPCSNPSKSFYDEIDNKYRYYTDSCGQRWKLQKDANAVYHQPKDFDIGNFLDQIVNKLLKEPTYNFPNKKYTLLHDDGSSSEAIWDSKKNRWLEDWEFGGPTFNYVDESTSSIGHYIQDMVPFNKYQKFGKGVKPDEELFDSNSFILDGHDYEGPEGPRYL